MKETMFAIKAVGRMALMLIAKAMFTDSIIQNDISDWVKKPGWKVFWRIGGKFDAFVGKKAYALANKI